MKYIPLFILIQLVSLVLMIIGIPVVLLCLHFPTWPKWAWIWFNDEDKYGTSHVLWDEFVWLALRNPVANLKHIRGVSKVGRPLFYRTWKNWYVKMGWMTNGYPACSMGSGRGY